MAPRAQQRSEPNSKPVSAAGESFTRVFNSCIATVVTGASHKHESALPVPEKIKVSWKKQPDSSQPRVRAVLLQREPRALGASGRDAAAMALPGNNLTSGPTSTASSKNVIRANYRKIKKETMEGPPSVWEVVTMAIQTASILTESSVHGAAANNHVS